MGTLRVHSPDASQQRHIPHAVNILFYLPLFQSCSGGAHAVRWVAFLYCAYAFDPPPLIVTYALEACIVRATCENICI